jgi:hypothetical protein
MDTDRRPPGADARTVRALRELAHQQEELLTAIHQLMDEEMLTACENALEHFFYHQPDGLRQEDLDRMWPLQLLRNKLQLLYRIRLRDELGLFTGIGTCNDR